VERRIVVIVAGNDPGTGIGGHARYVRAHSRAIRRLGFEPHVFCAFGRNEVLTTEFGTVHRVRSPFRPFIHDMVPFNGPILVSAVRKFLGGRAGPHLIHSFYTWGWVGARVAERLRRSGVTVTSLVSTYDTLFNVTAAQLRSLERQHGARERLTRILEYAMSTFVTARYEAAGYRGADCVYANYDSVRKLIERDFGTNVNVRILPYATEIAFTQTAGRDVDGAAIADRNRTPTVITASRHVPRKGLPVFLRALKLLADDGVAFRATLVGGGLLLERHRALVRTLGLAEYVEVPGFVPSSYELVRRADVFVLPSFEEGSGSLALLEALQAGVAVVASRIDGIPEDVTDGHDALLVPPGDVAALAGALRRLLNDPELRTRLATEGQRTFLKRFSAGALVAALRDEYAKFGFCTSEKRPDKIGRGGLEDLADLSH
jgi:glycosyltransferase involved in cell wall biosynthesis